jgi:hypothetical protein
MLVRGSTYIQEKERTTMSKEFTLTVDRRELATILAALRFHQDENLRIGPDIADQTIKDIATDSGSLKPLNFDEVGGLCKRMNLSDEGLGGEMPDRQ